MSLHGKTIALIAANFGRLKNNESKQRKAIAEYVELCGYGHSGKPKKLAPKGPIKISQEDIAKQLGISLTNLKRSLTIERNLSEPMKKLLDDGVIGNTIIIYT